MPPGGSQVVLVSGMSGLSALAAGEPITVRPHHDRVRVFSPGTPERLD
jgi:hypothetical protein